MRWWYFYPRPLRGGRRKRCLSLPASVDFYPRPLRGGRPQNARSTTGTRRFLSTPSARRATREPTPRTEAMQFLSTPSARRATKPETDIRIDKLISIHALCEEGDKAGEPVTIPLSDFYPRPLRGGRPSNPQKGNLLNRFLSTPSARRATG